MGKTSNWSASAIKGRNLFNNIMREIKFRGQTISGEWVYGLLCKPVVGKYAGKTFISNAGGMPMAFEVRPETVGQYIGLEDKEKTGIYDGDIVKMDSWEPANAQIRFIEGAFCLADKDGKYVGDIHYIHHAGKKQSKIIGNIHDNPELLKTN